MQAGLTKLIGCSHDGKQVWSRGEKKKLILSSSDSGEYQAAAFPLMYGYLDDLLKVITSKPKRKSVLFHNCTHLPNSVWKCWHLSWSVAFSMTDIKNVVVGKTQWKHKVESQTKSSQRLFKVQVMGRSRLRFVPVVEKAYFHSCTRVELFLGSSWIHISCGVTIID